MRDRGAYREYLKTIYESHPDILEEKRKVVSEYGIRGRVLDVGCGWGHLLASLPAGAWGVGLDLNPALLQEAQTRLGVKNLVVGNAAHAPFRSSSFDWVVAEQVIEHLEDPHRFLEEAHRLLRDDGGLFLSTPNRLFSLAGIRKPRRALLGLLGWSYGDPTHHREYFPWELPRLVSACNRFHILRFSPEIYFQRLPAPLSSLMARGFSIVAKRRKRA
jgi:2-polyprenyl-3-methyl-5-hydroxy-6-metoxy-1,4-benzoquinol methylase